MSMLEASESNISAEERKKERRRRIEQNNKSEIAITEDVQEKTTTSLKTGQQQVDESLFALDSRKHIGLKAVTDVRIQTNESEAKRRVID
jgi:hypothetical protein